MSSKQMSFDEQLNAYMVQIGCTNKQLAAASGLGEASISRYRKGERIPNADSPQIRQLAAGLASIAKENIDSFTPPELNRQIISFIQI